MKSPTPTRGVPIQLDRERHLRYSLKTLREMQEALGASTFATGLDQTAIGRVLWYGLRHEDPDLTVEAVEELVDLESLEDVMAAIVRATGGRATKDVVADQAGKKGHDAGARRPEDPSAPVPVLEEPVHGSGLS